jgi:hypothetical protein
MRTYATDPDTVLLSTASLSVSATARFGNFLLSVARPRRGRARPLVPPRRHLANWLKQGKINHSPAGYLINMREW